MNKIILGLAMFVFLIGIVSAIDEGDILTQEQVDGADFDTINLKCGWHQGSFKVVRVRVGDERDFKFIMPHSCLRLKKVEINETKVYEYLVYRWRFPTSFLYKLNYLTCRDRGTRGQCINLMKNDMREEKIDVILDMREKLKTFQTEDEPPENWQDFFP